MAEIGRLFNITIKLEADLQSSHAAAAEAEVAAKQAGCFEVEKLEATHAARAESAKIDAEKAANIIAKLEAEVQTSNVFSSDTIAAAERARRDEVEKLEAAHAVVVERLQSEGVQACNTISKLQAEW